jgi:hypothetical protein
VKPRVLISSGSYRLVYKGGGNYSRDIRVEQFEGTDSLGVQRWRDLLGDDAPGSALTAALRDIGRMLISRQLKARKAWHRRQRRGER